MTPPVYKWGTIARYKYNPAQRSGMARSQQRFVEEASDKHPDATKYDPRDPTPTWIDDMNAQPWNWMPDAALDRLRNADDPQFEAVEITAELMMGALDWYERQDPETRPVIPRNPMSPRYITGTLARFQNRLIKGHEGEAKGEAHLLGKGVTLIEAKDDPRWADAKNPAKAADDDGIDLIADDGTTYQIKAYKTEAEEREEMNADRLLEVVDGNVRERIL